MTTRQTYHGKSIFSVRNLYLLVAAIIVSAAMAAATDMFMEGHDPSKFLGLNILALCLLALSYRLGRKDMTLTQVFGIEAVRKAKGPRK
jgi:hypothetical protein